MISIVLNQEERRALLAVARNAIARTLGVGISTLDHATLARLSALKGRAFVTLKKDGALRGCIGTVWNDAPLLDVISEMARAAAFEDPRFPPLEASEWESIHLEITILSPLLPLADPDLIEIGKTGLCIQSLGRAGLLLPQVATEQGWDKLTFLRQLCRKAGLPPDAWKDPKARLYSFTGLIVKEGSQSET